LTVLAVVLAWRFSRTDEFQGTGSEQRPELGHRPPPPPLSAQQPSPSAAELPTPGAASPPREALPPFVGRIISGWTGEPVPNAEVTFFASEGAASVRSGPDGRFRFLPSRPGNHQLAAVLADGYVPFGPEWGQSPIRLVAPVPAGAPEVRIVLDPETRVSGRVQAENGQPLVGATVELRLPGTAPALASAERGWTTDARGEFQGSAPLDGVLVARHPGFLPSAVGLRREHVASQTVTLTLKPAGDSAASAETISGRVLDAAGAAVPGANVALGLSRWRGALGWALLPSPVLADADGRFRFQGVPENVGWAQARSGELVSDRVRVEAGAEDVLLTVRPGGTLSGRVTYADGRPTTAFAVRVEPLRRREAGQTVSVVDPDGRWEVRGLLGGPYQLQASAAGAGPSEAVRVELPATAGARVERDLRLHAGHRLSGTVRDANTRAPIPHAEVAVEGSPAEDSVLVRADVFTGDDGRFELDGLADAPATVTVEADGYNRRLLTVGRGRGQIEVLLRPVASGQTPATDLVGIGAVVNRTDEGIVLGNLVPSGGAALAGLRPGEVVTRIDGLPVSELEFTEAVQRLRGEEGTVVRLEVRRADGTITVVDVTRRPVSF
jgi:hypothetical protein